MRYCLTLNHWHIKGTTVPGLVDEFSAYGFDAFSFGSDMMLDIDRTEAQEAVEVLRAKKIIATIHTGFHQTPEMTGALLSLFGETLVNMTFDATMTRDSRGYLFDMQTMSSILADVGQQSTGTNLRFGVEDFPLDTFAADYYRDQGLGRLMANPRFGMLIDLGHLNLRLRREPYFQRVTVSDFFRNLPVPVIEIHVHDNQGDRDSHAHIGFGNVDFPAMARGLHAIGFDGISSVEIVPPFHGSGYDATRPKVAKTLAIWREVWNQAAQRS